MPSGSASHGACVLVHPVCGVAREGPSRARGRLGVPTSLPARLPPGLDGRGSGWWRSVSVAGTALHTGWRPWSSTGGSRSASWTDTGPAWQYTPTMSADTDLRRRGAWELGLVLMLALAGCSVFPNLPVEGPDGSIAVVLSSSGEYDFFGPGVVWVLDPVGNPAGEPFVPEEAQVVQVCDASLEGWLLLVVDTDEYGLPVASRLLEWSPGRAVREVFACPDLLFSPRYAGDKRVLFLRAEGESVALWGVDRETGEADRFESGVLAFRAAGDRTAVLSADGTFSWLGEGRLPVRIAVGNEREATFLFFSSVSLALDPAGRYLAISLDDEPAVVEPQAEPVPTLYLVDLEEGRVTRIATPAISPVFAPDGERVAFVAQALDRPVQGVFVCDLATREIAPVPGSEGALWVRWGKNGLLAAIEGDQPRLVRLVDGEAADLLSRQR